MRSYERQFPTTRGGRGWSDGRSETPVRGISICTPKPTSNASITTRNRRGFPSVQPRPPERSGTAMIVAIVALLLVTTICFSLVRFAVAASQQAERQGWRLQSVWLAESALAQAAAHLRDDADFAGGDWKVEDIGSTSHTGRMKITIATADDKPTQRTITATADFPDDATDRVRITRTLTLTLNPK